MKNGLVEKGDRFLVTDDMATEGLATYAAPASGGFECVVPAGTVLVADQNQRAGFPAFPCRPENYKEMEQLLVPEVDRDSKFLGYFLVCLSDEIGHRLQVLD